MPQPRCPTALKGLTVLERGWLSSNNVLLHGTEGEGSVLVDSSHALHGAQTVALLRQALAGQTDPTDPKDPTDPTLATLINTHLHSDHCGGNAAVQRAFGCRIVIPPGDHATALAWDEEALSYRATGQICERFVPDGCLAPGQAMAVGGRRWQALAAPGHDPHSIVLFDDAAGVLISADALWENGFGVVFPELDGEQAFDEVGNALDLIESLRAQCVIPGHGAPFTDIAGALQRARQRLAGFIADPARHARHAVRVMVKYHLLEVQSQPWPEFQHWFAGSSLCVAVWQQLNRPEGALAAFAERTVQDLVGSGALAVREGLVLNA